MHDVVQILGALCVLSAFAAAQAGVWSTHGKSYLLLNLCGSAVLAMLALEVRQWGFLLLEGVWAGVSAWSLVRVVRRGGSHSHHAETVPALDRSS